MFLTIQLENIKYSGQRRKKFREYVVSACWLPHPILHMFSLHIETLS